jgi:hypothetical protein
MTVDGNTTSLIANGQRMAPSVAGFARGVVVPPGRQGMVGGGMGESCMKVSGLGSAKAGGPAPRQQCSHGVYAVTSIYLSIQEQNPIHREVSSHQTQPKPASIQGLL